MRFAKVRLVVALLALFAWVGYIAYQALAYGRFPAVSHAQLLIATTVVSADVRADDEGKPVPTVHVVEELRPEGRADLVGQDLTVANLGATTGFRGPGRYVVPLIGGEHGGYRVAGQPRSPGSHNDAKLFIYPDTPLTRQQLAAVPPPPPGQGASAGSAPAGR